jgi:integrase
MFLTQKLTDMMNITTVKGRAALPASKDSTYWHKVSKGRFVGFRKSPKGGGSWWARSREDGKQRFQKLDSYGDASDSFALACEGAARWFKELDSGVRPTNGQTVRAICEQYLEGVREDSDKKGDEIAARFNRYVYPEPLASVPLARLRVTHVAEWRKERFATAVAKIEINDEDDHANRAARATVNRDMAALRAALNKAHERGLIASDIAWRGELKPLKDAGNRRDVYLNKAQRRKLVEAADAEIKPFLEALCRLPLRPGALADLKVRDFDARQRILNIGYDKGHARRIALPASAAAFFRRQVGDKGPGDALIDYAGGHWNKDAWKRPVKRAVIAAELPAATTVYALRHSVITDMCTDADIDLLTVARLSGTSVEMISRTYGHLLEKRGADALAKLY